MEIEQCIVYSFTQRTVVAPPSSVVKCLREVFVWGFGALFLSCVCVCVCVSGVLFSVGVCVCDLLIFLLYTRLLPPSDRLLYEC